MPAFVNNIDQGQCILIAAKRIPDVRNFQFQFDITQKRNYLQLC